MADRFRNWLRTLGAPEDPVATDTSSDWSAMSLLKAIFSGLSDVASMFGQKTVTAHTATNLREFIASLAISAGTSARFAGAYRGRQAGAINWYFMCSGMTLAPQAWTRDQRLSALDAALGKGVAAPRESLDSNAVSQYALIRFATSGKLFYVFSAGTLAGSQPSDAGAVSAGDSVTDGGATLKYTGITLPTAWAWALIDFSSDLATPVYPDSNGAYAGALASAIEMAAPTNDWLNTTSAFGTRTRMDVLALVMSNSVTDELTSTSGNPRMMGTFQGAVRGTGAAYDIHFLADSASGWRGFRALYTLHTQLGNTSDATTAATNATDVKSGVTAQFSSGRFKTYVEQPSHTTITGNAAFATDFRFHIWPMMLGMWTTLAEVAAYVDTVLVYTKANVPGLFNATLDDFPLSEWYHTVAVNVGWLGAANVLLWRVNSRASANVTITDAALALDLAGLPPTTYGGGLLGLADASSLRSYAGLLAGSESDVCIGPVTLDMAGTTAVQIGTTPAGGRFIPLEVIALVTAASAPTGIGSATISVGQTGAGYTDWLFTFLDASLDTVNEIYRWDLPASATAILSAPASTAIFAKMGTALSGGSMSAKVWVRGRFSPS